MEANKIDIASVPNTQEGIHLAISVLESFHFFTFRLFLILFSLISGNFSFYQKEDDNLARVELKQEMRQEMTRRRKK